MTSVLSDSPYQDLQVIAWGGAYNAWSGIPDQVIDVSDKLMELRITDSINEAARRVELTFDNEKASELVTLQAGTRFQITGRVMDPVTLQPGPLKVLFLGQSYEDYRSSREGLKTRTFSVYDFLTWLARTEDIATYKDQTLTQIFNDISSRYQIPVGTVEEVPGTLGQIVMGPGMTVWRMLQEAIDRAYRKTGVRYFIRAFDDPAYMELLRMGQTGVAWSVRDGSDGILESLNFRDTAQELRTVVEAYIQEPTGDDGESRSVFQSSIQETGYYRQAFGYLRKIVHPDNSESSSGQVDEAVLAAFREAGIPSFSATTDQLMLPGARRGDQVFLVSEQNGGFELQTPGRTEWPFYIDTVVSTYTEAGLRQTMDLSFSPVDAGLIAI